MLDLLYAAYPFAANFFLFAQRSPPKQAKGILEINTVIMIIIGAAIVAIIAVVGWYVGSMLRKSAVTGEKQPTLAEHLKTFREAADEGNMTDMEFAVVKKHLSKIIMDEVKQQPIQNEPQDDSPKFIPQ